MLKIDIPISKAFILKNSQPIAIELAELLCTNNLVFLQKPKNSKNTKSIKNDAGVKFTFQWFVPLIQKYKALLIEVLILSLVLQLIGLATPLFFQVVMDKVLLHHAQSTLIVISVGLAIISIFDLIMQHLRQYLFAHTTNRMDVQLGAWIYEHLLHLPLSYFMNRTIGDSVARIREVENIRQFLTSHALTTVLDIVFSIVFLFVMHIYSVKMTLMVIASLPLYFAISWVISPILKKQLEEKFEKVAENQSFLVESLTGIETIKAMAIEPKMQEKWNNQLAEYITSGFKTQQISSLGGTLIQLINKGMTILIMYVGAQSVLKGEMTVGQLIAFNMLSGQMTQPMIRLAQLWSEFQQIHISMARLGDILNLPVENQKNALSMPQMQGEITLKNITFAYPTANITMNSNPKLILSNFNLSIQQGQIIGIVGRSGSGKSTITKLITRFYYPQQGQVFIDGLDISLLEAMSIRQNIGVVLQENWLFHTSIRDNIALGKPDAAFEEIIAVAKMAGAHEFIGDLPQGYDTMVQEQGKSLSGGQRQRLAIARALLVNPKILIFDEATSALDYESERIIQKNMRDICANRTVIIIAHRASAVLGADRIIVMEQGQVIEDDHPKKLLQKEGGYFYKMVRG